MGRYFALTFDLAAQVQTKTKTNSMINFKPVFRMGLFLALVFLGLMYVLQVNSLSTKGYELKKLERRLVELREQNKRLELEIGAAKAIQNIEAEVKPLNLVPGEKILFAGERNGYAFKN